MKTCSKCGNEYPATTEFWHRNKARSDGFAAYCKTCNRAASREAQRKLVSDPNTGEVIKANTLASRKSRATSEGREASREATRESMRKRRENGKAQEYMVGYLDNNPLYKLRQQMSTLIHSSMRKKGWSKTTKTQALVGCSFSELMGHLKSTLPDYENYEVIHIDHILPCSSAENEDELNALQHYSNLQWLPGPENLSKSDTLPPDWKERKQKLMAIYWERFPERREAA